MKQKQDANQVCSYYTANHSASLFLPMHVVGFTYAVAHVFAFATGIV